MLQSVDPGSNPPLNRCRNFCFGDGTNNRPITIFRDQDIGFRTRISFMVNQNITGFRISGGVKMHQKWRFKNVVV